MPRQPSKFDRGDIILSECLRLQQELLKGATDRSTRWEQGDVPHVPVLKECASARQKDDVALDEREASLEGRTNDMGNRGIICGREGIGGSGGSETHLDFEGDLSILSHEATCFDAIFGDLPSSSSSKTTSTSSSFSHHNDQRQGRGRSSSSSTSSSSLSRSTSSGTHSRCWYTASSLTLIDRGPWPYAPWLDKRRYILETKQPFPSQPPTQSLRPSLINLYSYLGLPLPDIAIEMLHAKNHPNLIAVSPSPQECSPLQVLHSLTNSLLRQRILDAFTHLFTPFRASPRFQHSLGFLPLPRSPSLSSSLFAGATKRYLDPLPLASCSLNVFASLLAAAHSLLLTEGTVLPVLIRKRPESRMPEDGYDEKGSNIRSMEYEEGGEEEEMAGEGDVEVRKSEAEDSVEVGVENPFDDGGDVYEGEAVIRQVRGDWDKSAYESDEDYDNGPYDATVGVERTQRSTHGSRQHPDYDPRAFK